MMFNQCISTGKHKGWLTYPVWISFVYKQTEKQSLSKCRQGFEPHESPIAIAGRSERPPFFTTLPRTSARCTSKPNLIKSELISSVLLIFSQIEPFGRSVVVACRSVGRLSAYFVLQVWATNLFHISFEIENETSHIQSTSTCRCVDVQDTQVINAPRDITGTFENCAKAKAGLISHKSLTNHAPKNPESAQNMIFTYAHNV